ncbi:MAG: SLC13 family permease [Pirellulales bacterium]|nr:SLC13 family permease [Pirellulales bacterium]
MNFALGAVLILLVAAIVMFAINRPRMDAVALIMLTLLPFSGVLTINEALAGFSDANIVLIAALFVIGDGLVRTGVALQLGDWMTARAGGSDVRLLALLMLVVCGLGATMSSTAVTAIFIPVVLRIAQSTGASASQLMMPLSMAALISGMTTLVATAPNLVVNSELVSYLERRGDLNPAGFHFFSFTPFGAPILILAIVYMLFARRWLANDAPAPGQVSRQPTLAQWINDYQLAAREHRVRIQPHSPLANKKIEELQLKNDFGAVIVAIDRRGRLIQPTPQTTLLVDDLLLVDLLAPEREVAELRSEYQLAEIPLSGNYFADRSQDIGLVEVILHDKSDLIGKTPAQSRLRDRTGLTIIGLRRGQAAVESLLAHEKLQLGDTLLLVGPWRSIKNLQTGGRDFVLLDLPAEFHQLLPVQGKAPHAVACLLLVVGLMVSGIIPNVQAALIGCLLMGWSGCVTLESAYRSIDWKTIVLIVGMLPFSTALQRTGGVDLASDALMQICGGMGTYGILATLFAMTAILGMFISNTATAVLMAPIALAVGSELGASPYPFAMIVALAASTAFMTPVSSPVNTLVVTPGNYSFGDFVRVGVPFSLIVMVVSVLLVPQLLPLFPAP